MIRGSRDRQVDFGLMHVIRFSVMSGTRFEGKILYFLCDANRVRLLGFK